MDGLEQWVRETYAPLVVTCTTPEVERLARKNNLPLADLLNAFAVLEGVDAPIRSVAQSMTLGDFIFRFVPAGQLAALPVTDSMRLLNEVVLRHPPPAGIALDLPSIRATDHVPTFLRATRAPGATPTEPLPWYRAFKRTFMDTFRCEEFSLLSHPAALLLVVSSTETNPRHSFEQLSHPHQLPSAFHQGLYDPAVPKFYLILHDVAETDGTSIDPDAILQNLRVPTAAGAVLRLNSRPLDQPTTANAPRWLGHPFVGRPVLFANDPATTTTTLDDVGNDPADPLTDALGGFLTDEDLARMQTFVRDLGLRFVLPALETRIFQLNEVVSAMKKGVKNVFKSWLRKPKDLSAKTQASNSAVTYRYDSIEAQTRLLADTAFMVRDYDLALQMYRLVRDDYKSDKSMYHCANANEMIALCLLLTKGSPMQMTNALESATSTYYKVTNPSTCRLAVRAAIIAGEIYNTLSHSGLFTDYMDNASAALIRGSTMEQGICSAVLMERAAMCDLQARVPKFRKFGFRMVMAGHVYDSLGHSPHSARCYSLARAVYDSSGWFQVEDHINFTLAQQSNRLNDPMASINLFLKLIGTGRNSASQQEALLYEFGMIVKEFLASGSMPTMNGPRSGPVVVKTLDQSSRKLVVRDLCMPELDDKSTVVFAPFNATGIDRDIDGNQEEQESWRELERIWEKQVQIHRYAVVEITKDNRPANKNPWLSPPQGFNAPLRGKRNAIKKPDQYALGEKIYVELQMKNALSCAVDVENIHLYGTFEAKNGDVFNVPESDVAAQPCDRIVVDHVNLQLLPVSEERVRLAVCPMIPGTLRLIGVRWSICGGDVHGEHAFNIPGPLLQDTRANKEARARAPNTTLIADVVGNLPWLGVTIEPASARDAFVGEIVKYELKLINSGSAPLCGLQLCCADLIICAASTSSDSFAGYTGATGQVVDLRNTTLNVGEAKSLTLWVKGNYLGKRQAKLLFKYLRFEENDLPEKAISRSLRMKVELTLHPCVDVSYSVEPSYCASGEYILGLTVSNRKRDAHPETASVMLEQLKCISESWRLEPVLVGSPPLVRGGDRLGSQETSTLYFRVLARQNGCDNPVSTVGLNASQPSVVGEDLPVDEMLCLEHAQEVVRIAEITQTDSSTSDRSGGIRSIQSVRRENKAQKASDGNESLETQQKEPDPQPTSRQALLSLDIDAHLILLWSTIRSQTGSAAVGQTNMTSIKVRSLPKVNVCPLTITMSYQETIVLKNSSSSAKPLAELEVFLTVRNDSALQAHPVEFTLEVLHPEEARPVSAALPARAGQGSTGISTLAPSPHFFWTGLTRKRVPNFAPDSKITISLRACFLSAGIYDLNRFRFLVSAASTGSTDFELSSSPPAVFVFPVEYLVNVRNCLDGTQP